MRSVVASVSAVLMWVSFAFGALHYLSIFGLGFLSRRSFRRSNASERIGARHAAVRSLPGVSILMPAYNEEVVIVEAVRSALSMNYEDIEVIVVSDGSSDRTVEVLVEAFNLSEAPLPRSSGPIHCEPVKAIYRSRADDRIVVVDKGRAGSKGDGTNCGVNLSSKEWVVVMDGDELVDPDALLRCMTQMVHTPGDVRAIGVSLLPTNECTVTNGRVLEPRVAKNPIVGFQTVEYLSAFVMSRPGMAEIGAMPIISGGFGLFRRCELVDIGGFPHPHLGEDLEIVVRLRRKWKELGLDYKVIQVSNAIVWTEFPASITPLRRQRMRWHRGLRQVLGAHRDVVLRPKYGTFGTVGMGVMFLFEWLAPFVEVFGYATAIVVAVLDWNKFTNGLPMLVASQALGLLITTSSVWTATHHLGIYGRWTDTARLIGYAVAGQLGFRQLTLYWRMKSLGKSNMGWGAMTRVGYKTT
jgi:cellulose synthase/poly-beta-1,6-N-acetylglucosamine synthase-like glycosyltransferase